MLKKPDQNPENYNNELEEDAASLITNDADQFIFNAFWNIEARIYYVKLKLQ